MLKRAIRDWGAVGGHCSFVGSGADWVLNARQGEPCQPGVSQGSGLAATCLQGGVAVSHRRRACLNNLLQPAYLLLLQCTARTAAQVVMHFINDYEKHGKYTGFPCLGVEWQVRTVRCAGHRL